MKRMMGMMGGIALALVTGCTGVSQPKSSALDGQAFKVAIASERGGPPDVVEMRFDNGTLESSDARREGAVPAAYVIRSGTSFEAEARAPGAVRRFRGTIDGARIEGDLELSRDGLPPARYTFRGEAI
jgi:hypothetical protein